MSSGFKEEVVVLTSNSNDKVVNFLNELRVLLDKHSAVIAILVSTLLFALIHLPDYIQAFNASVGGIVAGILYFKSKRIVIPILFHITWNLIAELDNFFKLPFM